MEKYSKFTRFCFICNYATKIIKPISSRCALFKFKPIRRDFVIERLKHIAKNESVNNYEEYIETVADVTNGDLRQGIILLETLNTISKNIVITKKIICELTGIVPKNNIKELYNISKQSKFDEINKYCKNILNDGYTICDIFRQLCLEIMSDDDLTEKKKSQLLVNFADYDKKRALDGDDFICLISFCCEIYKICKK